MLFLTSTLTIAFESSLDTKISVFFTFLRSCLIPFFPYNRFFILYFFLFFSVRFSANDDYGHGKEYHSKQHLHERGSDGRVTGANHWELTVLNG